MSNRAMSDAQIVTDCLNVWIGKHQILKDVTMSVPPKKINVIIGPSGCGKTTLLKCFNRLIDLTEDVRVTGTVTVDGEDIYAPGVDVTAVRRKMGLLSQKPFPLPMSIYDNVAYGPRLYGGLKKSDLDDMVEHSLRRAALWDEVKDKLKESAFALSGGQQQRLCIARCIAVEPDVILMDEPCSALDPIATAKIEDLMEELKREYTIVIVTHNMQQAARVSDRTAFITTDVGEEGKRIGRLVEFDETNKLFTQPTDPRTEGYITGRFG